MPVRTRLRSSAVSLPRPPWVKTIGASICEVKRSVGRPSSPMPVRTVTRICSSLKSVGLTVRRTPFGKVTTVAPTAATSVRLLGVAAAPKLA
ncbi:hypothetical protein D3C72_2251310 [compost metagenome]